MKKSGDDNLVRDFYQTYYARVFGGKGFASWAKSRSHEYLERPFRSNRDMSLLELGAGTGEHFRYVADDFDEYVMVDLFEKPTETLWEGDSRVSWHVADICDDGLFSGRHFDRVIMTCVLHHLESPLRGLLNIERLVAPGGTFSLYLPTDPGLLSRLARAVFITPKAKANGFKSYELVNAREHRNHYWGLRTEIENVFKSWTIRTHFWPTSISAADINAYSILQIRKPIEPCSDAV